MKLKNHKFFKKYRILKYILLIHLAFSLLIFTSELIHGVIDGNILGNFQKRFENYKAFDNPEQYLKKDYFVVDTAYIEITSDGSSRRKNTIIKGNLINSKNKKELSCSYRNIILIDENYNFNEKIKVIKVWRNTINDEVFLGGKNYISREKTNAGGGIYSYFSLIPLIIILLILKNKSENQRNEL
ncbi:hypothetical protein KHA90_07045 [Flavobacterium psychroterrae]|jgi:hypothetical protein|uniref:Uncharacterized protein n=1 Tax=Flavobacterium psychroterrae TaxID=2133767 RepID=A0ABS5P902_9FLAO|nr:hypothetical protein [Flavobacterium psychroterrae]MBS7230775.1 hypothetical protein [Flavobacterium psychroterrae]